MTRAQAIAQATAIAAKKGGFRYAVKDGLAGEAEWEVCTGSDLDTHWDGASCVIECDRDGMVPESA